MRIDEFPNCCAAIVVSCFGGGHEGQTEDWTKQAVIDYFVKNLKSWKNNQRAVVFCCPTTSQPNAIAALRELGFYGYEEDEKGCAGYSRRHRMFPFFLPLMEWDEKAFKEKYDPEKDEYKNKESYHNGLKHVGNELVAHW